MSQILVEILIDYQGTIDLVNDSIFFVIRPKVPKISLYKVLLNTL